MPAGVGGAYCIDHFTTAEVSGGLRELVAVGAFTEAYGELALTSSDAFVGKPGRFEIGHGGADAGLNASDLELQTWRILVCREAHYYYERQGAGGHAGNVTPGLLFEVVLASLDIHEIGGI